MNMVISRKVQMTKNLKNSYYNFGQSDDVVIGFNTFGARRIRRNNGRTVKLKMWR